MLQSFRRAFEKLQVAAADKIAEKRAIPRALVVVFIAHAAAVAADVQRGIDVNRQASLDGKRQRVEEAAAALDRGSNASARYGRSDGGEWQLEARGTIARYFSEPGRAQREQEIGCKIRLQATRPYHSPPQP